METSTLITIGIIILLLLILLLILLRNSTIVCEEPYDEEDLRKKIVEYKSQNLKK